MSIYGLKPRFQALLRPVVGVLYRAGVTANQVTLAACVVSVALGAFLFRGDDVDKSIGVLSGGEKARVALAKILVAPGNFLLLDEPTNHLDTESADILADSLNDYDGTIVFVSHNLAFARKLATQVWYLENGALEIYPGSLEEFLEQIALIAVEARGGRDLELAEHALVRIDLFEAADDFLRVRLDRQRRGERLVARGCGARQLVCDDLVHAADLLEHGPAQGPALLARLELAAHDRERRFQAVREIGKRVAIALQSIALGVDEGVEARGQPRKLGRVRAGEMILAAALIEGATLFAVVAGFNAK